MVQFGFDEPVTIDGLGEDFELPDGDKGDTQVMSFVLTDEQASTVREAMDCVEGGGA